MRLALLGGSFNPVHRGHLDLAELAWRQLSLDAVLLVPASCSPFKQGVSMAAAHHRLAMLQLAVTQLPHLWLETCELERPEAVSYSIDTVQHLERKYRSCRRFALIIGLDQANLFASWHRGPELLQRVDLVVARRRGVPLTLPPMIAGAPVLEFDSPCSSTLIRQKLARGEDTAACLLPSVQRYITKEGVY